MRRRRPARAPPSKPARKAGSAPHPQRESPRRAAHHPLGGFVSLASREAPFRHRHVRRPVPRLSPRPASPPRGRPGLHRGIGCVQRPRSRRGHLRTRHRARLGLRLRLPRRLRPRPGTLPGSPLRAPRLGLPPAFGSGTLRLRPLSLADSHVNTFGRKPQVPILAEPGEIGRKHPKSGRNPRNRPSGGRRRRGLAGETPPSGGFHSPVGSDNSPVGPGNSPVGPGQLPRWTAAAPRWTRQLPRWLAGQLLRRTGLVAGETPRRSPSASQRAAS